MEKIPTYKIDIVDDNTGEIFISLVDNPAIDEEWFFFNEEKEQEMLFFNDLKKMVTGPVLIPNQMILRKDINGSPAYVYYDEDTIVKSMEYFFKQGAKFDVMHNGNKVNVGILESYLLKENNDMNLPKGSWVVTAKINDDNLFNAIKSKKLNGFSFKGLFTKEYMGEKYGFSDQNKKGFMEEKMKKVMDAITSILFTEEVAEEVKPVEEIKQEEQVQEVINTEETSEQVTEQEQVVEVKTEEVVVDEVKEIKTEEVVENKETDLVLKLSETIISLQSKLDELTNKFNEVNIKLDEYSKQPISKPIVEEITNAAALKQNETINKAARFFAK